MNVFFFRPTIPVVVGLFILAGGNRVVGQGAPAHPTESAAAVAAGDSQQRIGTIAGRVFNSGSGEYLNNARVTLKGTDAIVFTDSTGYYRLTHVPLGQVTVEVTFTGMEAKQAVVDVKSAEPIEQNIELSGTSNRNDGDVVTLGAFVVASKMVEGSAIALQEQRVAPNIKKVVAANEFGLVPDGNIGEFLKLMPGIAMSTRGGDPREVFINGAPSSSVPITVDGFGLASSEISGTGRNVELNNTSINTLSRIEAVMSVTPDTPASALAGTINLVPRTAFERAKPEFQGTVYLNWRDTTPGFTRTKGPRRNPSFKTLPGFELSWVVPVNKRFGFTVSAGASAQYLENSTAQRSTRGSQSATNGAGFPTTTVDQPYLSDYLVGVQSKIAQRSSLGLTADYRLNSESTLSLGLQAGTLYTDFSQRNLTFLTVQTGTNAANRPLAFSSSFTHGGIGKGQLQSQTAANNRYTQTYMPTLHYRYKGAAWSGDAGAGYSRAQNIFRNVHRGIMNTTNSIRNNVTVNFDDVDKNYIAPAISVFDGTTGAAIDPYNISNYVVQNANGNEQTKNSSITTVFGHLTRDFSGEWPVSIKVGAQMDRNRNDNRSYSTGPLNYVGADKVASTAPGGGSDDGSGQYYDPNFFQRVYLFGAPRIQWVDNVSIYQNYVAHPEYWTTSAAAKASNESNASKFSDEIVSATYFRGDIDLLDHRLHLNGGVRAEQTNVDAAGPLSDPRLGVIDRGYKVKKEYFRLFPSFNARYTIREDLLFRLAYYKSIGRPDFGQYSGGLTLPDTGSAPSSTNRLTINNAAIKAWSADTVKATLEYYFPRVGNISVSAFRRDYKNFFGGVTSVPTREFLDLYGLDFDTYKNYNVVTQTNLADVLHTQGMDIDYKQALTFLPNWARGVQVFANVSWLSFRNYDFNNTGANTVAVDNFGFFVPRIFNYGVSLTRAKFSLRLNANLLSKNRQNVVTGSGIEAGTYAWKTARRFYDVSGEYLLTKRVTLFGSIRNIGDEPEDVEVYGPNTPRNSVFRGRNNFYALITVGVKGKF